MFSNIFILFPCTALRTRTPSLTVGGQFFSNILDVFFVSGRGLFFGGGVQKSILAHLHCPNTSLAAQVCCVVTCHVCTRKVSSEVLPRSACFVNMIC